MAIFLNPRLNPQLRIQRRRGLPFWGGCKVCECINRKTGSVECHSSLPPRLPCLFACLGTWSISSDSACRPRMAHRVTHASRIVDENRDAPLRWVEDTHWGRGVTRGQGRNRQGWGAPPIVVRRSSLEAYHRQLVQSGA